MPLKPMGDDAIEYIVQMSVGQTGSYKQVSNKIGACVINMLSTLCDVLVHVTYCHASSVRKLTLVS